MLAAPPSVAVPSYLTDLPQSARDRSRSLVLGFPERVTAWWLMCVADLEASLKG